jgi:hypothetical protein
MSAVLSFDEMRHIYRLNDRVLPSVTQALSVIENFDHIPPEVLERARIFGRYVHLAVDLFNRGDLKETSLDPQLAPRLAQYKQFLFDSKFQVTHTEQRVYSSSLGYAGTLDIRGRLDGWPSLIDCKSGAVPRSVGPQTAAYRECCDEKPPKRFALQLADDRYRLIPCQEPSDFSNFLSALNVYRFQRRNNVRQPSRSEDSRPETPRRGPLRAGGRSTHDRVRG